VSAERIRRIFEINVLKAFLTAREAARRLSKSLGGAGRPIVLMSSAAARLGSPNLYIDYAASKGAIDTLTLGLAKELGPEGVRVNAIRPGLVEHRNPRQRRRARPGKNSRRDRPDGPPRFGGGNRSGGYMADQRRSLLCHRRAAGRLGRALTGALNKPARG
jgi:NAD(P)-dependent dehydrogenase (short-subunit alcohol dehydrogenase family)